MLCIYIYVIYTYINIYRYRYIYVSIYIYRFIRPKINTITHKKLHVQSNLYPPSVSSPILLALNPSDNNKSVLTLKSSEITNKI